MTSHTEDFAFNMKKKRELVHLTPQLGEVLARANVAKLDGQRSKRLMVKVLGE